jgi:hemerythrin-like domain-containing protein
MPVTIGAPPQAGFDQPLKLLQDCHRRIENFLDLLQRVVASATDAELDLEHRSALERALEYFRDAAPKHTQDEDLSLFPRLRHAGGAEARAALRCVESLESDHIRAAGLHTQVDLRGQQWLQAGRLPASARQELRLWLEELRVLYHDHIQVEESRIFPLAGKILTANALISLGQEMRARRARPVIIPTGRQPENCRMPWKARLPS